MFCTKKMIIKALSVILAVMLTFTATLYSADGEVLATDTIEMKSKAGFFDKIGGFFRSLFGTTKIYEN